MENTMCTYPSETHDNNKQVGVSDCNVEQMKDEYTFDALQVSSSCLLEVNKKRPSFVIIAANLVSK